MSRLPHHRFAALWLGLALTFVSLVRAAEPPPASYAARDTWTETMLAARAGLAQSTLPKRELIKAAEAIWFEVQKDFPVECDWAAQDSGGDFPSWLTSAGDRKLAQWIASALTELGADGAGLRSQLDQLQKQKTPAGNRRWLDLYVNACEQRRALRLRTLLATTTRILFIRHSPTNGSELCLLDLNIPLIPRSSRGNATPSSQSAIGNRQSAIPPKSPHVVTYGFETTSLVKEPTGDLRGPAVSWDAQRVVFSWKKSPDTNYHLFELEPGRGRIRQLTSGEGVDDIEPAFLPNGDLVSASTRCAEMSADGSEARSLFTCDPDGRFLRRLTFDSGQAVRPRVLQDGRVVWGKMEGKSAPALFQMNADGTDQQPLDLDNESPQAGDPFRLSETEFLVSIPPGRTSISPSKRAAGSRPNPQAGMPALRSAAFQAADSRGFPAPCSDGQQPTAVYWMDAKGRRELLAADPLGSCVEPVPLAPRPLPFMRASTVDYAKATGTIFVQDIYAGLPKAARGSIRILRVLALERPPAGALLASPGDAREIRAPMGDAKVYPDGSAFFNVPARTPLCFQALDTNGSAVWTSQGSTALQPGETLSCVSLNAPELPPRLTPAPTASLAARAGAKELEPFAGPARGFSFSGDNPKAVERRRKLQEEDQQNVAELAAQQTAPRGPTGPMGGPPMGRGPMR